MVLVLVLVLFAILALVVGLVLWFLFHLQIQWGDQVSLRLSQLVGRRGDVVRSSTRVAVALVPVASPHVWGRGVRGGERDCD